MRVLRPTMWAGRLDTIMTTRKRHSPEQVVRKLMAADRRAECLGGDVSPLA